MYEIVRVVESAFLIDASRHACRYETADGRPLEPGFYLACWPVGHSRRRSFTREVSYVGPYASRAEAEAQRDRATSQSAGEECLAEHRQDGAVARLQASR